MRKQILFFLTSDNFKNKNLNLNFYLKKLSVYKI